MAPARRAVLAGLWLAAAALFLAFVRGGGPASVGDDSVSYVLLAQHFAGTNPHVRDWVAYQTHFGPLLPLVLAVTGAAADFARARLEVGFFAALALVPMYRLAARRAGSGAGLAVVAAFLLMPTAWISALGILTEPLFLLLVLATLDFHEARLARPQPALGDLLVFGALLALAVLTRMSGMALAIAYAVHALVRAARREPRAARLLLVPAAPFAALAGAWLALRAAPQGELYGQVLGTVGALLAHDPWGYAQRAAGALLDGWIASFTAQSQAGMAARLAFTALGLAALAGGIAEARRNRLAGWYALAALATLFFWRFPEDTMRRLLYPVVPVLLVQLVAGVRDAVERTPARGRAGAAALAAAALPAALCIGPALLVLEKATQRAAAFGPGSQSLAEIADYYTTIPLRPAAEQAGRHLAVLAGLGALAKATPPDARVMWMRPDYVAVLGRREGVAWYYAEGLQGLARRLRDSGARYVIGANLYKSDMGGEQTELFATPPALAAFARPVYAVRNPAAPIDEFILFEVDPAALREYLARGG